jgi:hypothetical protein
MLFTRVAPRTKNKGLPIGGPLFRKTIMLFTRVAPRTKSNGLLIGGPYLLLLSARASPRTKSKGLRISGRHLLLLSTCASPRTKSKGLLRYVLQNYYFNQVSRSFGSSAGVIIPFYHPNNKSPDPNRWFHILLVYSYYQYTRSKGHLFIFIFIKFIQHAKEKDYKALGLSLSSDSARLVKSYEDLKS